jgi:mRNA-degrading endonuclease YafQ of YafQ-DinJ toxin-antitoxin module
MIKFSKNFKQTFTKLKVWHDLHQKEIGNIFDLKAKQNYTESQINSDTVQFYFQDINECTYKVDYIVYDELVLSINIDIKDLNNPKFKVNN